MIDIVFGRRSNPQAVKMLVDEIKNLDLSGTLYIGYPIFDVNDDTLLTDALLVTEEHGVIAFDLTTSSENSPDVIEAYQDDIHRGLLKRFLAEKSLVQRRNLSFEIAVVSMRSTGAHFENIECVTEKEVSNYIYKNKGLNKDQFKAINAAIQKTNVLKPLKKRSKVVSDTSFGAAIKKIEKEIANLDHWQKKAAIESPDKPQRIRGLAGCGKTIILAMKAAYIHAYAPTLKVCVTFQTRSLYQQLEKLTDKFFYEHVQDEKDPEYLKVQHAWGSLKDRGVYAEICLKIGIEPLNFLAASNKYGKDKAFEGACEEALNYIGENQVEPIYDYLLIDEAQDFPVSFFKLAYKFVKSPHRIVWAYDELQNLGDFVMLPPDELFGCATGGAPLVSLQNQEGKPQQDIMLPICYRNPPWTLTLALALGLGIYRKEGLVRMFPDPKLWENIGYEIVAGDLKLDSEVTLQRASDRTPGYFDELINPESAIVFEHFDSKEDEAAWVAQQIEKNIKEDELEISDIMIVFPSAFTINTDSAYIIHELRKREIACHVAGKNTSRDILFLDNSVAICHVHRAKGNEAPMVYVMNANYCSSGFDITKKRNSLFTSITRAKAWVRLTGTGPGMRLICDEINKTFTENFRLLFKYPSQEELDKLESAYKDKTESEAQEMYEGFNKIKNLMNKYRAGEISIEDVPEDLRDLFS